MIDFESEEKKDFYCPECHSFWMELEDDQFTYKTYKCGEGHKKKVCPNCGTITYQCQCGLIFTIHNWDKGFDYSPKCPRCLGYVGDKEEIEKK